MLFCSLPKRSDFAWIAEICRTTAADNHPRRLTNVVASEHAAKSRRRLASIGPNAKVNGAAVTTSKAKLPRAVGNVK
jgi:predicted LPLAT superfamily acyltransferase